MLIAILPERRATSKLTDFWLMVLEQVRTQKVKQK
jgi:hypothetical protein